MAFHHGLAPPHSPRALSATLAQALGREWHAERITRGVSSWEDVAKRAFEICKAVIDRHRQHSHTSLSGPKD